MRCGETPAADLSAANLARPAAPHGSTLLHRIARPTEPIGLYDPTYEHDACGVAFVAKLDGHATHETIRRAIVALESLDHRGAEIASPNPADGAGIPVQMADELMRDLV